MTTTSGSAKWQGGIKDGKGAISTKSGALNEYPYGFASRFEGKPGSNPEELIGAAHAACFTMALSLILGEAKLTAEHMETKADVTLEKQGDGFAITSVHLTLNAKIPGADKATFEELTGKAKAGSCGGCHGANGEGKGPAGPAIAGMDPAKFVAAMKDYKSGKKANAPMKSITSGLGDTDIENLAAHYASLKK